MKLTLGKAAKAAGISKPSLSAAIKKGRLSAEKNDAGHFEIDPAELFRVYPKQTNTNGEANGETSPEPNSRPNTVSQPFSQGKEMVNMVLAEQGKLIAEKERAIERLVEEKQAIRADLEDQKEQNKRITLLLENHGSELSKESELERSFKALESRLANQERAVKEKVELEEKIARENRLLRKALKREREMGFMERLFKGNRRKSKSRRAGS